MNDSNIRQLKAKIKRSKRLLFKYQIYNFLHRPTSILSKIYHIFSFFLIFACLLVSIFPVIEEFFCKWPVLKSLEFVVLIWFASEFSLNFWASDCRPQYQGVWGKVKFLLRPTHLIEWIIIIISAVLIFAVEHEGHEVFAFQTIRGFNRFFQVLQVVTLHRQIHPLKLLLSVIYNQWRQILLVVYLELFLIVSLSYLTFIVEHETNDEISTFFEAFWWAVETLSTTGYGDRVPNKILGRVPSGIYLVFSVALFALQGTVIGVGWALKVEEIEKDKLFNIKTNMAAHVIQKAWRCYWEARIYKGLQNTFGYLDGTGAKLLKERLYEQALQLFIALLHFHVAKSELCQLRRPMELKNIIESQKFEKTVTKMKMRQVSKKIENTLTKLGMAENEQLSAIDNLVERYLRLKQLHPNGKHCSICCTKNQRRRQKMESEKMSDKKQNIELMNDVYATITTLISESSYNGSLLMQRQMLRQLSKTITSTSTQEVNQSPDKERKESIFKRTKRRFSQWTQRR